MTPPVCPPVGELRAYLLGELSDADCDELAGHVQGCPECQGELATVDDREDTLLEHLRLPRAADNYSDEDGCRLAMVRALPAPYTLVAAPERVHHTAAFWVVS